MAAQLAGSNATLGRRGEGLLLLAGAVRRRQKAAAGGPAQRDTQALLTGQDDLDLLAPQVCVCECVWGGGVQWMGRCVLGTGDRGMQCCSTRQDGFVLVSAS